MGARASPCRTEQNATAIEISEWYGVDGSWFTCWKIIITINRYAHLNIWTAHRSTHNICGYVPSASVAFIINRCFWISAIRFAVFWFVFFFKLSLMIFAFKSQDNLWYSRWFFEILADEMDSIKISKFKVKKMSNEVDVIACLRNFRRIWHSKHWAVNLLILKEAFAIEWLCFS